LITGKIFYNYQSLPIYIDSKLTIMSCDGLLYYII
jgi:hypothetical protein